VSPDSSRAYALLTVKSVDLEQRVIEGIASTPETDRVGDIMIPTGAQFKLPMPLLWQHDQHQPIGEVIAAHVTSSGIHIKARIAQITEAGRLKDRIDEAWQAIRFKLVRGLSIGFRPVEAQPIKGTFGSRISKWLWFETSAVTIPANQTASIQAIKSLDVASRPESGMRPQHQSRGVPPSPTQVVAMTISEQLTAQKAELQTNSARLEELMGQDEAELNETEIQERDALTGVVESHVKKIKQLSALEAAQAAQADTILFQPEKRKVQPYNPTVKVVDHAKELPKGTLFARYAMAVAAGKGSLSDTLQYAKRWDTQTPEVSMFIKAVAGSSVEESPGWGSQLVYAQNLVSEFIELLRPATILGRINGLRMVPFNVRIPRQTGGSTVNWVGEKAAKPVTELSFDTVTVPYHKAAGIIVLTEELVRLSSPSAEATVRTDLVEQMARFLDAQFITPTVTVGANNPASITNLVASPPATGTDADALYVDLNTALATFDTANMGTESVHIIMTPALARGISTLRTTLGVTEFPAMSPSGGSLLGFPVIVSNSVPSGTIVLVKANEILVADDGRVTLDASNQATLDMTGGDTPTFNLWQKNCIGIRAERWITWLVRRAGAVAVIDTASYGPSVGSP
jgi:HK97 family phage major capsid protein/HK97 family phage prohead protease